MKTHNLMFAVWLLLSSLFTTTTAFTQDTSKVAAKAMVFPDKVFSQVEKKSMLITRLMDRQTKKYMTSMYRQEEKMKRKIARKDSLAAANIFINSPTQVAIPQAGMSTANLTDGDNRKKYIPHLDSLTTAFKFMSNNGNGLSAQSAIIMMENLQSRFTQAEEMKRRLEQRKNYLQQQLARYGAGKELAKYQKQFYYYKKQVSEYQELFEKPSKMEEKALAVVQKTAMFKDFFSKHSELANLFRLPASGDGDAPLVNLQGLQARVTIEQSLMQRFGTRSIAQQIQPQMKIAHTEISSLKKIANKIGGNAPEPQMPDFKPNGQKTKRLLDRLEYGFNLQSTKTNAFFPATSDLGLSIGYKLNDKSVLGVGSSYKMGWGKDIRHVSLSHQGLGLRSFGDYKLKGSFWVSGGAEINYKSSFKDIQALKDYSAWQQSALLGISKKYKMSNKMRGNLQLMYDFLYNRQTPVTQPIIFRMGYAL